MHKEINNIFVLAMATNTGRCNCNP